MDKMFYTIQEVCGILAKSEDEVREMVSSGQLQEFRDKDELVFKVEQINLLAGVDEDSGEVVIDLGDTDVGASSSLGLTGGDTGSSLGMTGSPGASQSAAGLGDSAALGLTGGESAMDLSTSSDAAGLSAFDTGAGMQGDDAGETRVGDGLDDDLTLESVGSGSGLLDLTRESDDTSLGAELLEEVYSSDEDNFDIPANASGLFEAASPDETEAAGVAITDTAAAPARPMNTMPVAAAQEAYDGAGSGLGIGASIGGIIALVVLLIIGVVQLSGSTSALAMTISESIWIWTGGLLAVAIVAILAGMFVGRASE